MGEKSEKEIKIIKKSCTIASGILKKCINNFSKFSTEKDVETFLHTETIKNGCELAFPTIVASGKGGSMPHYEPKNVKLRKGFCVIDFGVKYEGYCSDITRTIYLGKPSVQEKKIYDIKILGRQVLYKNKISSLMFTLYALCLIFTLPDFMKGRVMKRSFSLMQLFSFLLLSSLL